MSLIFLRRSVLSCLLWEREFYEDGQEIGSRIAELVQDKKIEGIRDLRDESTSDIRVVVELKGTAHPQAVLNALYKMRRCTGFSPSRTSGNARETMTDIA